MSETKGALQDEKEKLILNKEILHNALAAIGITVQDEKVRDELAIELKKLGN